MMLLEYANLWILLCDILIFYRYCSYVSVITFSLSEAVCIIKVFEKDQASEVTSDRYGHKILAGEFFFRGNYLKLVR